MIAEMFSIQLIWIHISLHFLIYLFKFLYRTLLAVNVDSPTELSAICRQGVQWGKKRPKYKMKIHSIKGKVEKNTNNGKKQKTTKKQPKQKKQFFP